MSKIKIFYIFLLLLVVTASAVFFYFLIKANLQNLAQPSAQAEQDITWGIDFSQSQAEYLTLDWKKTYLALIQDLGATHIKLHTNWNWLEGKQNTFYFKDTDWQVKEAEQHKVKLVYVLGMKTGRWPECHMPSWTDGMPQAEVQSALLEYITNVVQRYKHSKAIAYWQVENEPLLKFGECPSWYYSNTNFLKEEVALVKSLDPSRKIIVSDSGELSNWETAASIGDVVGITMYRNAWSPGTSNFGINPYSFLDPDTYAKKVGAIKRNHGKEVICIELQAEPWASKALMDASLKEQFQSMNPEMFKENISFAEQTGVKTFYFWGAEWWYWLKTNQNQPQIWDEAKTLFHS